MSQHARKILLLLIVTLLVLVGCNFPIKDLGVVLRRYATLDPAIFETGRTPTPPTIENTPAVLGTAIPYPQVDEQLYHVYAAQSGDTLNVVASHFGVALEEISSPRPIPAGGIIAPGQYLVIPKNDTNRVLRGMILPDSAVINSPCAQDFNVAEFVSNAGGYLSSFSQLVAGERISGAAVVQRVADNQSVSPLLLLAFIEYRARLVYGSLPPVDIYHPLNMNNRHFQGLYQELSLAARMLNTGYYGWRYGTLNDVVFTDELGTRIAANLNAGSAGVMHLFAALYPSYEWEARLLGADGFTQLYASMFGDPMLCAARVEPLLTDQVPAPDLQLPFGEGEVWAFTAGPHYSWVEGTPLGALDFAPNVRNAGCAVAASYARAAATGRVTRADNGVVVLTLEDENGQPTGWEVLYLHIAAQDSVSKGTRLNTNDPIGHPSCEGGSATGTHVHIARKYKGEWIGSAELFPFILSGWLVLPGRTIYTGTMIKEDRVIFARQGGDSDSLISR
jgi:LysM repeat protein/murein DD-endopeptidase MepM/ murein hydrolase activator NlpD